MTETLDRPYWEKTWHDYPLRTRSEAGSERGGRKRGQTRRCSYCYLAITTGQSYFAAKHAFAHYVCVDEGGHNDEGPNRR